MENELLVWKESHTIKALDTGASNRATFTSMYNYFQNAAYRHADTAERLIGGLLPENNVWMLSRLEVEADDFPGTNEEIRVETWSNGGDGLFVQRDFLIYGTPERPLMRGISSWLIVDTVTQKVNRHSDFSKKWTFITDRHAIERKPEKLPEQATGAPSYALQVRYSDLDRNNHVNNGKYIEWIMNSYPPEMHGENTVKKFEMNFLGQALYKDTITVFTQKVSDTVYLHSAVRESDGKEVCRARVQWRLS